MPSIGWSEMLMLAMVAIIVVGPKELPRLMRVVGHWTGKARAAAREFQKAFDDMARESEVEEMRRTINDLRNQNMSPDTGFDKNETPSAPAQTASGNGADASGAKSEQPPADDPDTTGDGEHASQKPESRAVPSH